jgi:hypothetical protein
MLEYNNNESKLSAYLKRLEYDKAVRKKNHASVTKNKKKHSSERSSCRSSIPNSK